MRPRWTEQKQFNRGKVLFQVRTFSYGNWGWKVGARIINHSPFSFHQTNDDKTRAPYYLGGFQIVTSRRIRRPFFADYVTPAFPPSLQPGATWSGTFGASELLVHRARYQFAFGYFLTPPQSGYYGFYWITTHTIRVP